MRSTPGDQRDDRLQRGAGHVEGRAQQQEQERDADARAGRHRRGAGTNSPVRSPVVRSWSMARELAMPRMIDATTSRSTIIGTIARNRSPGIASHWLTGCASAGSSQSPVGPPARPLAMPAAITTSSCRHSRAHEAVEAQRQSADRRMAVDRQRERGRDDGFGEGASSVARSRRGTTRRQCPERTDTTGRPPGRCRRAGERAAWRASVAVRRYVQGVGSAAGGVGRRRQASDRSVSASRHSGR